MRDIRTSENRQIFSLSFGKVPKFFYLSTTIFTCLGQSVISIPANTRSFSFSILTSLIMSTLLDKICNLYSKEVIIRQNPSTPHTSRIAKKPGSISPCGKLLLTLCRITISNDYPYSKLEQSARTIWAMSC